MRLYKIILITFWLYWLLILFYSVFPQKWPTDPNGGFTKNRLLISYMSITGPPAKVLKGNDEIRRFMNIRDTAEQTNGILLSGNTPASKIGYPAIFESDFIVYGDVVGKSDRFVETGYGVIPIFEVDDWDPLNYKSRFWSTKSRNLFIFLFFSLCILPILIILTLHFLYISKFKGRKYKKT